MKPLFFLIAADLTKATGPLLSGIIVLAAIIMVLNQLGLMPKGKTAERLQLDLSVSEKELKEATKELEILRKQRDLDGLTALVMDHDRRMTELAGQIADKLNIIASAVVRD